MTVLPEDLLKILLAVLLGGAIGIEREYRDKAAGFRTIIFISVGATLFTIFSIQIAGDYDPGRIAANIVTGVGFLGAGVVLRDGGRIVGLTTASIIWVTSAIGMGIGSGHYLIAGISTAVTMVVLWIFPWFEKWVADAREDRVYEIVIPISYEKYGQLDSLFKQCRLRVRGHKQTKYNGQMICTWDAMGSPKSHALLTKQLFADGDVKSFKC